MKELSIAGKATRYDDALKEAVIAHKNEDRHLKATLERIFPELKESEDEKIKGAAIEFVRQNKSFNCILGISKEKVITWLKQGEQKPDEVRTTGYWNVQDIEQKPTEEYNITGISSNKSQGKLGEIIKNLKQEWSEEDENYHRICLDLCTGMPNGGAYAPYIKDEAINWLKSLKDRVLPKQEWSEEDEEALEEVQINFEINKGKMTPALQECYDRFFDKIKTLNPYLKKEWSEEDKEFINDLIGIFDGQQYQAHSDEEIVKWLKSIRLPYNKEWDENDEEMLKSIIATCELACEDRDSSPARHLLGMQTNWLKSLRPQNRWKPSGEQMEFVWKYAEQNNYDGKVFARLYNDLKKLKGE